MKSSYPTPHNNKIEEQNKTTLFAYHTLSWKNITHTLTYTHTCAYVYSLLTSPYASVEAPASINTLTISV